MRRFTSEEDQFIKDHYLSLPGKTIDDLLDRTKGGTRQRMAVLGLIVPNEILIKFKQESCFQKGRQPFNKGKKWSTWMSKRGAQASKKSQYKSGHRPWHTHKQFDIQKWQKPNEKPYLVIYLAPTRRKYLHRYVWEQANGDIPKGYNIAFKDGNTMNCNINNLELVSNADMMIRNSAQRFGPEIFKIIQLRGALNRQINKRLKQLSNEK